MCVCVCVGEGGDAYFLNHCMLIHMHLRGPVQDEKVENKRGATEQEINALPTQVSNDVESVGGGAEWWWWWW